MQKEQWAWLKEGGGKADLGGKEQMVMLRIYKPSTEGGKKRSSSGMDGRGSQALEAAGGHEEDAMAKVGRSPGL